MNLTPNAANVLAVFSTADPETMVEGLEWYDDAHAFAKYLSPHKIAKGAGVIAALSPMMGWEPNKRQAERAFRNGTADGLGLIKNCAKAERILYGADPLTVLSGNKVRAFYSTILNPKGFDVPVIDRHAFDIAIGEVTNDAARSILSRKGEYDRFGQVYIDAAKAAGVSASQMQAVTWVAWRKAKANA